jgi:hypothetical protein
MIKIINLFLIVSGIMGVYVLGSELGENIIDERVCNVNRKLDVIDSLLSVNDSLNNLIKQELKR